MSNSFLRKKKKKCLREKKYEYTMYIFLTSGLIVFYFNVFDSKM